MTTQQFKVGDKVRFKSIDEAEDGLAWSGDALAQAAAALHVVEELDLGGHHVRTSGTDGQYVLAGRLRPVKTRKVITKQGIFNHVYRFLLKQGRPARDREDGCMYRGTLDAAGNDMFLSPQPASSAKLCCAAGCLISDREFDRMPRHLDGGFWGPEHSEAFPRLAAHQDFIRELQAIHDRWKTLASWKNEMHAFAALHGLTVPADV